MRPNTKRRAPDVLPVDHPRTFVARLILAELLAKRGEGPLARRPLRRPPKAASR